MHTRHRALLESRGLVIDSDKIFTIHFLAHTHPYHHSDETDTDVSVMASRHLSLPASRFTLAALPVVVVVLLLLPGFTGVGSQVIYDDLGWHTETLLDRTDDYSRWRSSCTNASEEVLAIESAIEENNMMDG